MAGQPAMGVGGMQEVELAPVQAAEGGGDRRRSPGLGSGGGRGEREGESEQAESTLADEVHGRILYSQTSK